MIYNSNSMQKYARRLYRRSYFLIVQYGFTGLVLGFWAGVLIAPILRASELKEVQNPGIILAFVGLIAGVVKAELRALQLRASAQALACLAQIEENTRQ